MLLYKNSNSSDLHFRMVNNDPAAGPLNVLRARNVVKVGEWIHVAGVTGPGGTKFFVNGVLAGEKPYAGSFSRLGSVGRLYFGENPLTLSVPEIRSDFVGAIDEFRVWNRARNQPEIQADMNQRLTGTEPGLVGLWNFDTVENGEVKDRTAGGHHGRLVGNARIDLNGPMAFAGGMIQGRVRSFDGSAVARVLVQLVDAAAPGPDADSLSTPGVQAAMWTDVQGNYAFGNVRPGSVNVPSICRTGFTCIPTAVHRGSRFVIHRGFSGGSLPARENGSVSRPRAACPAARCMTCSLRPTACSGWRRAAV